MAWLLEETYIDEAFSVSFINCRFLNNNYDSEQIFGGLVYLRDSSLVFFDSCEFLGNVVVYFVGFWEIVK